MSLSVLSHLKEEKRDMANELIQPFRELHSSDMWKDGYREMYGQKRAAGESDSENEANESLTVLASLLGVNPSFIQE